MNDQEFLDKNYDTLVKEYGGKIVLIRDNSVVFADILTRTVLKYAKEKYPDNKWLITLIDSGEAAFF